MTIDKERLRVLAEAATPGPWTTIERGQYWGEPEADVLGHDDRDVEAAEFVKPIGDVPTTRGQVWLRDAEFIAAARDAVPALLSENAALAAEVERTSNNRDMWKAQCAAQAKEFERLCKDERDACAVMCDQQAESHELSSNTQAAKGCDDCAAAIRARGSDVP